MAGRRPLPKLASPTAASLRQLPNVFPFCNQIVRQCIGGYRTVPWTEMTHRCGGQVREKARDFHSVSVVFRVSDPKFARAYRDVQRRFPTVRFAIVLPFANDVGMLMQP